MAVPVGVNITGRLRIQSTGGARTTVVLDNIIGIPRW